MTEEKRCISISEGDTDKKRTKHIAKHFHFVKEKRAAGLVVLKYLATALQVADGTCLCPLGGPSSLLARSHSHLLSLLVFLPSCK